MAELGALKAGRNRPGVNVSTGYRTRTTVKGIALAIRDPFLREGLKAIIEEGHVLEVVASAEDLGACLTIARQVPVEVLVIELSELRPRDAALLPGVRAMGMRVVGLGDGTKLPHGHIDAAISRAQGKTGLLKSLLEFSTIRPVAREPRATYGERLSPRERDVAMLIAQGLPNRDIATKLDLREQSIKNLASVVMRKLQCDNRVQVAIQLAQERPVETS